MTDREFYQSELIKCLEQIKDELEESRYGLVNDGIDLAVKIIDKRLEKARKIKEINKQFSCEKLYCEELEEEYKRGYSDCEKEIIAQVEQMDTLISKYEVIDLIKTGYR